MKTDTHGNGNGLSDLYILPDTPQESERITDYLKSRKISYSWAFSDNKGQDWYGQRFIDIPFGESLADEIRQAATVANNE